MSSVSRINDHFISPRRGRHVEEVSMSDYAHSHHASKISLQHRTVESRALYGACYLLFLLRAAVKRVAPWQASSAFGDAARRESIFVEARTAAGVIVSSSFMGL